MNAQEINQPADTLTALAQALPFSKVDSHAILEYDTAASDKLGRDYWRLKASIKFYVGKPEDNLWVWVPEGFLTDGATVPRWMYWLIPPWGRYGHATVIHDYLCENLQLYHGVDIADITRKRADQIFNEALKVTDVNPFIRWLMYSGVTAYRWFSRKTNRKPDANYRAKKAALEEAYRQAHRA